MTWVCIRSVAGIAGSNPAGGWMSVVSVVRCQVEVSASGWSLVQRRHTECGVSECDRESSRRRRPWHTRVCGAMKKKEHWWSDRWQRKAEVLGEKLVPLPVCPPRELSWDWTRGSSVSRWLFSILVLLLKGVVYLEIATCFKNSDESTSVYSAFIVQVSDLPVEFWC